MYLIDGFLIVLFFMLAIGLIWVVIDCAIQGSVLIWRALKNVLKE